jgi:hypothetical protein
MAEIEYEVREQDLIAFNEHQLRSSETLQKVLRRHQGTVPGILVLIAMFLWFYYQDTLSAIYVGATAAAWGVLAPLYIKWSARRQIRKLYSEQEKAGIVGVFKLRAEPDALVELSRQGESRIKWSDVLRIEATKRYAFVFVGLDTALIIPRATVRSGNVHEFLKDTDKRIEQAS